MLSDKWIDEWIDYDRLNNECLNIGNDYCYYYPPTNGRKTGFIYQVLCQPSGFSHSFANSVWTKISTFLDHNYPKLICKVTWHKSKVKKFSGFIRVILFKKGIFSGHIFDAGSRGLKFNDHILFSNLHLRIMS